MIFFENKGRPPLRKMVKRERSPISEKFPHMFFGDMPKGLLSTDYSHKGESVALDVALVRILLEHIVVAGTVHRET